MEITLRNAKKVLIKYLGNNKSRYYHSLRVAKVAKLLAEKTNENVKDAIIAALLHDIGKAMNEKEVLDLCARNETIMYDFEIFNFPNALHGRAGAIIFEEEFDRNFNPEKFDRIKQAIAYHVAGGENKMSLLDKIIYIADNIEPGKQDRYDQSQEESLLYKIENDKIESIDDCIKLIIDDKKKRAEEQNRISNPLVDNILEI